MESISTILDRVFPKELNVTGRVTMEHLAQLKTDVKKALPEGAIVELTLLMNSILLGVYVQGEGWHRRSCQANIS